MHVDKIDQPTFRRTDWSITMPNPDLTARNGLDTHRESWYNKGIPRGGTEAKTQKGGRAFLLYKCTMNISLNPNVSHTFNR